LTRPNFQPINWIGASASSFRQSNVLGPLERKLDGMELDPLISLSDMASRKGLSRANTQKSSSRDFSSHLRWQALELGVVREVVIPA
jgi:hypothetical protein